MKKACLLGYDLDRCTPLLAASHPNLAKLMRRVEEDVLVNKSFPPKQWSKLHSTDTLQRLNKEIKRRTNAVGIFPNKAAVIRLVRALMLEQDDECAIARRYMTLETVTAICEIDNMDPAKIAAQNSDRPWSKN